MPLIDVTRKLILVFYILILGFILHLIYTGSSSVDEPRFKLVNYTESHPDARPIFESNIIPKPSSLIAVHSASFEVMDNGDLLAVWFGGSHEGRADVKIWSSRFTGNQWSDAKIIVSPQMLSRQLFQYIHKVGNPVIYKATNGVLHLFIVSVGIIGGWSGSNIDHVRSLDNGATWDESQKLVLTPLFNISTLVRTKAITLTDGGFYLPVYHEMIYAYPELLRFDANGNFIQKIRMTSKDDLLQPELVVSTPTSAYAFLRNKGVKDNVLYMQYGKKGGLSWGKPQATNLSNRDSSVGVIVPDKGKLLMVHNPLDRNQLILSISTDGLIWRNIAVLEDRPNMEYSYPSIQIHNGLIDILYTYERKKIKHVRFNLAWLQEMG